MDKGSPGTEPRAPARARICVGCGRVFESTEVAPFCTACRPVTISDGGRAFAAEASALLEGISEEPSEATSPAVQPGCIVSSRYRILQKITTTRMSQVYLADDLVLSRKVVIKYLNFGGRKEAVDRFCREATLLASLKHPNIVSVYDFGTDGKWPFIILEYIEGIDLERFNLELSSANDEQGRIFRILECAYELCNALDYLHAQGIIHRDIKPSNILMDRFGHPHLIDFGIARRYESPEHLTETGAIVGTPLYMSPEQAGAGDGDVDQRSDIFSLGVMLYRLLTRAHPFETTEAADPGNHPPAPPSRLNRAISGQVEAIVLKALSRKRESRYKSAREMAQEIEPLILGAYPDIVRRRPTFYHRNRGRIALWLNALAFFLLVVNLLPLVLGGSDSNGRLGGWRTVVHTKFEQGMLPGPFRVIRGSAERQPGLLSLRNPLLMIEHDLPLTGELLLTFTMRIEEPRPSEFRIGVFADPLDPELRGHLLRLRPDKEEGTWEQEGRIVARFRVPEWVRWGEPIRFEFSKRSTMLRVQLNGTPLFELEKAFDPTSAGGATVLQAAGGNIGLEEISLSVREPS